MVLVGERRQKILEVVSSGKAVTVEELSRILDVSPSTVRRDLRFLGVQGPALENTRRRYASCVIKLRAITG